jgi:hypothetical protein
MTDFLDALEQQLVGAARARAQEASPAGAGVRAGARAASPTRPAIARRRGHERALRRGIVPRRRWLLVLLPALLVLAVGGLALGGVIEVGSPAKPEYSASEAGFGALTPGSARLEPVSAPDPAGGPAWGLRVYSTKLGVGCLQTGRLLDGHLGALGEDGAFGDDGSFHEVQAGGSVVFYACSALDGNGRVFNNVTDDNVPVSGWNGVGACAPASATAAEKSPEQGHKIGICPESDERDLHYGLLGPEAESITYTSGGETRTLDTSGPDGAYLIVERASPTQLLSGKGLGTSDVVPVDGPITEVHYRDGSTCHLTSKSWIGGNDACTPSLQVPVGYKPVKTPTQAEVTAPVSARLGKGPHGEEEILVSFASRVSLTEYRSAYSLQLEESGIHPRAFAPYQVREGGEDGVKAGEVVTVPIRAAGGAVGTSLPAGEYKGAVRLISATGPALFEGPGTRFLTVGTFSIDVP